LVQYRLWWSEEVFAVFRLIMDKFAKASHTLHGQEVSPFRSYLRQFTGKAEELLSGGRALVLVYIDIKDFRLIDQKVGSGAADRLLRHTADLLESKAPDLIPQGEEILAVDRLLGDEFVVFYTYTGSPSREELNNISISWHVAFKEYLNRAIYGEAGMAIDIHIGCAAILPGETGTIDVKLYSAVREAQKNARGRRDPKNARMLDEFNLLLEEKKFEIQYQPIVSLYTGTVLGWEALTRGPRDSHFRSPQVIFNFAAEVNLLYPLERLCRNLAVRNFGEIERDQKIFLNINPLTISDPNFVKGETINLINESGLNQRNIVFEITEQADLRAMPNFKRTLEHYRSQGYMVAIDDTGAGFSSLQAIAQVRPDYIKIDMSLVRGVDTDPVKKALIETLVAFAEKIGSFIIAEGIETEDELHALIKMGAHFGQGYYLGRPAFPKKVPGAELSMAIARLSSRRKQLAWRHSMPVSDIVEECLAVTPETPVWTVRERLEKSGFNGVVVVKGGRPVGLVMKQYLYGHLSTQYGVALYSKRPVTSIMDSLPMIIESGTPVETASQAAMSREKAKIYDNIIVTRNGQYAGMITVQNLINSLTRIQLEFARGANPLTGLPGNNAIEEEINTRLLGEKPFVLVYVDLDNFKSYNDKYGFDSGDHLLLFTSKILSGVCRKFGGPEDFVGHLGGDDFVIITSQDLVDKLCTKTIKYFDRLVPGYYPVPDRARKGISGVGRDGRERWFPFISISMALVEVNAFPAHTLNSISQEATSLKKYAKSLDGSVFVRDRRHPPGR
jgi:EAL domain-containing protein (putative c-di-GMP-specific phosphodiesterase class I)/GGDEF domain-containing protein/CBS domain-containing protein